MAHRALPSDLLDPTGAAARPSTPPFHGWRIAWGAMALQATVTALFVQAYGVYAAFWMAEFGWTRTTIALLYSLQRTESGLLGPVHGWLLQRVEPRALILTGLLLLGGGFLVLAHLHGLVPFVVCFLVMAVGASLAGILSLTTVLVNWFDRRRARVLAMLATGLSVGGLAVPLVGAAMEAFGWRAVSVASGVLVLGIGVPLSRTMHREPEALGQYPDGRAPDPDLGGTTSRPKATWTAPAALRTRAFWQISLGHAAAIAVVSAMIVHFVVYARETFDLSVTSAASVLTLSTALTMLGQALGGWLGDRYPKRHLAGIGMLGHAAAMALLASTGRVSLVVVAVILHGLAWGLRGPLMGAMRADYFGRSSFAMIMGASSLVVMLGSVLGPLLPGILADTFGTYRFGFGSLAAVAIAGAAAFFTLEDPKGPRTHRNPVAQEALP